MTVEVEKAAKPDGKELYRELLTMYPSANYEDYYKQVGGIWNVETLEIDLELIKCHRLEAGAPEATPMDEVNMPDIPKPTALPVQQQRVPQQQMPKVPSGPTTYGGTLRAPGMPVRPAGAIGRPGLPKPAGPVGGAGPSAELQAIALFIQKWKLEATKAKLLLARLTPPRRKWVMQNYAGASPLEEFVENSQQTNAWASAGAVAAPAATGMKRPLIGAMTPAAKAAKVGGAVATTAGGMLRMGAKAAPAAATSWIGTTGAYGGRAAGYGSGVGVPKPAGAVRPLGGITKPAAAKPAAARVWPSAAKPGAITRPVAKPLGGGPPKAKAPAGSLIKSLLKNL